jgi:predicted AlkP superfamily pyrophosphatase or phosphodiesterase
MSPLTLVFVVDGLRPDAIDPEDTPTLHRLRAGGVSFADGHAVFPTVTRVNAATLATGAQPGTHGILGNTMYVPAVNPRRAFSTGDWRNLVTLDQAIGGRLVPVATLADRLAAQGRRFAAVSSGSTGSAFLLNPRAPRGVGVLVNGYFGHGGPAAGGPPNPLGPGPLVAFPPDVNEAILARFGAAPPKGGRTDRFDPAVDWTQTVLREYVLRELRPDVVINWITEPDHTQHALGAGSPDARAAIRNADRHIGLILDTVEANVFVASDHGFTVNTGIVDVARELIDAGLKAAPDSDDVVVASSGQAMALHVKDHALDRVQKIVAFLQSRPWIGVIFTAPGSVEGTFPLALIHAMHDAWGPDILFTFPWTSARNAYGVPGGDIGDASSKVASDHGSMSPWNVRSTLLAWGPAFKRGAVVRVPAGNVDVAPTILALHGLDTSGVDGRVLREALVDGPDEEQVAVETRIHTTEAGAGIYRAVVQTSEVDGRRYVDKGWRVR